MTNNRTEYHNDYYQKNSNRINARRRERYALKKLEAIVVENISDTKIYTATVKRALKSFQNNRIVKTIQTQQKRLLEAQFLQRCIALINQSPYEVSVISVDNINAIKKELEKKKVLKQKPTIKLNLNNGFYNKKDVQYQKKQIMYG